MYVANWMLFWEIMTVNAGLYHRARCGQGCGGDLSSQIWKLVNGSETSESRPVDQHTAHVGSECELKWKSVNKE
jgi:hypothetical protein